MRETEYLNVMPLQRQVPNLARGILARKLQYKEFHNRQKSIFRAWSLEFIYRFVQLSP